MKWESGVEYAHLVAKGEINFAAGLSTLYQSDGKHGMGMAV